jgi:hypothetical protein
MSYRDGALRILGASSPALPDRLSRIHVHRGGAVPHELRPNEARRLPVLDVAGQMSVRVFNQSDLLNLETLIFIVRLDVRLLAFHISFAEDFRRRNGLGSSGLGVAVAADTGQKNSNA